MCGLVSHNVGGWALEWLRPVRCRPRHIGEGCRAAAGSWDLVAAFAMTGPFGLFAMFLSGKGNRWYGLRIGPLPAAGRRSQSLTTDEERENSLATPGSRQSDRRAPARRARSLRPSASHDQLCDLKAAAPLVEIVGMLDRYHGLAAGGATSRQAIEPHRISRAVAPLALTHAAPGLELSRVEAPKVASARKWRRNGLKTLNQRPEMVVFRKPRSHKMWYTGARLTVRSD
jgi:hypothetical protein